MLISPSVTARARRGPAVPDAVRTQHGPAARRHRELRKHARSRADSVRAARPRHPGGGQCGHGDVSHHDHPSPDHQAGGAGSGLLPAGLRSRGDLPRHLPDGRIVAELAIDGARFRVADEAPEASNLSPQALNGTTVRINLLVADPDQFCERAIANGAVEVAPIADQTYGLRQGRLADPFGHHWLVGRPLAGESGDWARTPDR